MSEQEKVAIIGLGGVFPDANGIKQFWDNICRGHVAIGEIPADRWDWRLYFSEDHSAPEKSYSRIGGFIKSIRFDAKRFRIPPKTLDAIDEVQQLALLAVADALEDAGYEAFAGAGPGKPFDRERTAVIVGNSMGGEAEDRTSLRVWYTHARAALEKTDALERMPADVRAALLIDLENRFKAGLPIITEDSMPGELSNCIAGRIANALDLRGPNFTTDAACAASLAALKTAVMTLQAGECDLALSGGADHLMDPPTFVKFSKIGALSGKLSAPFDARADGFVMGEGVGILVLKRLSDAVRDGDHIYAVIEGIGAASDGKGKGITAPNPRGQRLAVERAYRDAGVNITDIGLFEAHGTSTVVGDATEARVLTDLLKEAGAQKTPVPIGSVKSMIGHLKSAAGAAALIKATLAIHHRLLPPSANFVSPPADSPLHEGYLAVNTETRPWRESGRPRRAAVSAFGFGGANFHVILREHQEPTAATTGTGRSEPKPAASVAAAAPAMAAQPATDTLLAEVRALFALRTGYDAADLDPAHNLESDLGIDTIKQAEIFGELRQRYKLPGDERFRLADTPTLAKVAAYVAAHLPQQVSVPAPTPAPAQTPVTTATPAPAGGQVVLVFGGRDKADLLAKAQAAVLRARVFPDDLLGERASAESAPARLAFVAADLDEARHKVTEAGRRKSRLLVAQGIFLHEGGEPAGKIAFLFPGQGSQYVGMLKDLAAAFPVVAETFREADAILRPLIGSTLTDTVWAEPKTSEERDAAELKLRQTEMCQPAMLAADVAIHRLLAQHGVSPHMVAGHSLGEWSACVAAGVLSFADALYAVSARGREMSGIKVPDNGKMASVAADLKKVESVIEKVPGYVIAANKNCHTQTVIAGDSAAIGEAVRRFSELGVEAREIPVSHAFHSKIVAPASEPLARVLAGLTLRVPSTPILSNVHADYYPADVAGISSLLTRQLAAPVEFIAQIERMYADGARIFLEVGPRRATTGFVRNVLGEQPHDAVATNHPKKPGPECFLEALAALAARGVPWRFAATAAAARPPVREQAVSSVGVVISGVSVILPTGEALGPIDDDAIGRLLAGENFIRPIDEPNRRAMLEKNVVRLDKVGGTFEKIRELGDVLQLAARLGDVDLVRHYGLDANFADALDVTSKLAIAVGIDALRDAGLPLVRHYRTTSTGKKLPDRWALPKELARRTGVIFSSAFPGVDRVIDDVSRHMAARHAGRSAAEIETLLGTFADTLRDPSEAARLRELAAQHAQKLRGEAELYTFNRKFLLRILSMGHSQVAQTILAQGPNTQVNSACASGTLALGIASDWITSGRADRVLVVGADDVTREGMLPWLGAGFLASGAATAEADVREAAVPFGLKRNGLIMGAGACGVVLEGDADVLGRGIEPIAELVLARFGNSAFHATRLEPESISQLFAEVIEEAGRRLGCSRDELARRAFFMSHETYTPARGGSASAEVAALRHAFGPATKDLLIANTKGYTGHPMGASLEDVTALKALQRQIVPPIANLSNVDPAFVDLKLSRGGHAEVDVAIHFAAGFGSQMALAVFKRRAAHEARLADFERYQTWLDRVTGSTNARLEVVARTLRVAESGGQAVWELGIPSLAKAPAPSPAVTALPAPQPLAAAPASRAATPPLAGRAREELLREIQSLFAEQTGYGVDDLDPAHQLEADLGIDTVKQAEIFGILRQRYNLPREESFKLAEVPTLAAVVDYVLPRQSAAPVAAATEMPAATSAGPEQTSPDGILREVQALFAEQTGYSASDLDPAHQLEADLGIDTVKQAEIFGILRQRYGLPQDERFKLADVPTLNTVAAYVLAHRGKTDKLAAAEPAPAATQPEPTQTAPAAPAAPDRVEHDGFAARAVLPVALGDSPTPARSFAGRRVVVAGGDDAWRAMLRRALVRRGAQVHVIQEALSAAQGIEDRLANLGGAPADDVIYAAGEATRFDATAITTHVAEAFSLARALARSRRNMAGGGMLLLGRSKGLFGFMSDDPTGLTLAALAGLAKSLAREWQDSRALAVDLDTDEPLPESVERALDEYLGSGPAEVGWRQGRRYTLGRDGAALASAAPLPQGELRTVATGGARGITFAVLRGLAALRPLRVLILARTAGMAPEASPLYGRNESEQKEMARLSLATAGQRVTPAAIRRHLAREQARIEVHQNLAALRALGAEVDLIVCDVADPRALAAASRQARARLGGVDLLLHGAGSEESKLIADKDSEAFDRVFLPKARAALELWEGLKPARMVTFGSVAGRFGNAGQCDYAAANELMAALARSGRGRLLNIAWTAWDEVGMAAQGSARQVLVDSGVDFLPAKTGVKLATQLILSEAVGDVVVAGRLGALASGEHVQHPHDVAPWIFDRIETAGDLAVYVRRLDPSRDVGLDHHRIDGVPVLPGVVGVEMMVQAAEHAAQQTAVALEDVRFAAPLKLYRDEALDAHVEVRLAAGLAQVALVSLFAGPGGKEVRREHFFARVLFSRGKEVTRPAPWTLELARQASVSTADIYRRYFHGPSFQVLGGIESAGENGVTARPTAAAGAWLAAQGAWRSEPVRREAAFQAAGVWEMTELGRMGLPSAIARVDLAASSPPPDAELVIEVRKRHAGPEGSVFDAWVRDASGRLYDVMRGYRTATLRDLAPDERFEPTPPHQGPPPRFLTLDLLEVGEMLAAGAADVLPHYLSAAEQTRFGELKTDKRRLEYLAGRVVAKRLVRQARFASEGAIVPFSAITILADVLGAPELQIVGEPAGPLVSITHGAGVAAAYLAAGPGMRPGIDVEKVERRDASFLATYFTQEEQAWAQPDPDRRLTAMWAVKEAVLKALGVGARVDMRELVTEERDGTWHVTLSGQAREVAEALGVVETSIEVEHDRERVFARVQLLTQDRLPLETAAKTPREVLA